MSISRRNFLTASALTSLSALSLSKEKLYNLNTYKDDEPVIKAPALKKGDKIGLVAPASNIESQEYLDIAKETMEYLGFRVEIGKNALKQYGYLAGTDEERADDVNEMFRRKDIDGIFCIRGGYGTMRILPLIDYESIKKNPKVIIGYSDITALLLAIHKMTGLITFHGPVAGSTFNDYTIEYLNKAIFSTEKIGLIKIPKSSTPVEMENRLMKFKNGKGAGRLIGGNLTLFVSLFGTPYDIDVKNKLLFFEDVGEEPYRIDRMLTQVWLSGKMQNSSGIIFGKLTNVKPSDYKPAFSNNLSNDEILRTRFGKVNVPSIYGYLIGHIKDKVTIPIGAKASIDVEKNEFVIEENSVV